MTTADATVLADPIDIRRCRFVVDRPLYPDRWAYLEGPDHSPLAARVFGLGGVASVLIAHDKMIVARPAPGGVPVVSLAVRVVRAIASGRGAGVAGSWSTPAAKIGRAIRDHLASGEPAVEMDVLPMASSIELRRRVQAVLDESINPVIAGHGGEVTILDLVDNVLYVRMQGGCQGCGLADMTLKHGVEAAVRDAVPEIGDILDLTNHAAGRIPYRPKKGGNSPFGGTRR